MPPSESFEDHVRSQLKAIRLSVDEIQKSIDGENGVVPKLDKVLSTTSESSKSMNALTASINQTEGTFSRVGDKIEAAVLGLSQVISTDLRDARKDTTDAYKASRGLMSPKVLLTLVVSGLTLLTGILTAVGIYQGGKSEESAKVIAAAVREEFQLSRHRADERVSVQAKETAKETAKEIVEVIKPEPEVLIDKIPGKNRPQN